MNYENIKKITNQAIEQLMQSLDGGPSEALTQYLGAMAKFRAYSVTNVMLILNQRPQAQRVAGYKTWKSFGRQVKYGEKGIMIIAPQLRKLTGNTKDPAEKDDARSVAGYRAVYVWDVEQTEGKDLPEIGSMTGDPGSYLGRLEDFVRGNALELCYSADIAPARGMAQKGRITVLPGMSAVETFATLVHELAHSDLHFGERRSATSKRLRETEAESVAYVVCAAIGLDPGTSSADYIGLYGGDAKLLIESLEHVRTTASRILDAVEPSSLKQAA